MSRRSPLVRLWAVLTVFALAFSQVAMAAFAPPAAMPAMAVEMASEQGCHEVDPGTKHVCIKTCQGEPQKDEAASLAALPPALDTGLRIDHPALTLPTGRDTRASLLARATAPPPHLLFTRFLK